MKAWQCSRSQWLAQLGVHEPYIAEISLMQVGLMSARQRTTYDKRRAAQWATSSDAKVEWARQVIEAYEAFEFDMDDADLASEARTEVEAYQQRATAKAAKEAAEDIEDARWADVPFADIQVGDVIRTAVGQVKVLKKNRVTLRVAQQVGVGFELTVRGDRFERERA